MCEESGNPGVVGNAGEGKHQVFPWFDDYWLKAQHTKPLQLVARAVCLIADLEQTAREINWPDQAGAEQWLTYGLSAAFGALANDAEPDGMGIFLAALESLVPPERRARWPLSDKTTSC